MLRPTIHQKATFLRDAVFAANDGVITTFAVVAGSYGAGLGTKVIVILGLANLFADGISMASGNYLGVRSEMDYREKADKTYQKKESPVSHAIVTFISFIVAGLLPIAPYLLGIESGFNFSLGLVAFSLLVIGLLRGIVTKRNLFISSAEMLIVGGGAAAVAFFVGRFLSSLI